MTSFVALLYSVVIGGGRRLKMDDLRLMASSLGFRNPSTVAATGNLIFEADDAPAGEIEQALERAFAATFGRHVDIILRETDEWPALMDANPFADQAQTDPAHVAVRVGRHLVGDEVVTALEPYLAGEERIVAVGRDLWMWFPHGIGTSRLASAVTPKRAGIGTARNFNTVRRIGEIVADRR